MMNIMNVILLLCNNMVKCNNCKKNIMETIGNYCIICYFNIHYNNKTNFDMLINNDKIDIYGFFKKYKNVKHNHTKLKCILCDINNGYIIKNLRNGEKIYGEIYKKIGNKKFIYNETMNILDDIC